jgi:hypothetical protein
VEHARIEGLQRADERSCEHARAQSIERALQPLSAVREPTLAYISRRRHAGRVVYDWRRFDGSCAVPATHRSRPRQNGKALTNGSSFRATPQQDCSTAGSSLRF